ncbi:hypothetical protein [Desulfopila sp. IMCC35008]|uniref:hypothetical protein n=1 Tax=Desulfopila sp. IMCC35008 TaxID=2653858 RepID=UPI0013D38E40|nr:hypothetical protein [Desulfopila sp. IMCC35008]
MNKDNLHTIIQYVLLCARQDDDHWRWELGPIHLLKFAYLADLLFAKRNNGKTFTDVSWVFYDFGPWSAQAHEEIPLAVKALGANEKRLPSEYGSNDYFRWSYLDNDYEDAYEKVGNKVPLSIALPLRVFVSKYGKDTPDLLDYVYNTIPMRNAAPGETLDFTLVTEPIVVEPAESFTPAMTKLSGKKRKQFKARLNQIKRAKTEELSGSARSEYVEAQIAPMNDETMEKGLEWLDDLAGPPLPVGKHDVEFDDSVWKSSVRRMEKY